MKHSKSRTMLRFWKTGRRGRARHALLSIAASALFSGVAAGQGVDVRQMGHFQGNPFAPVQIVEFADFGCSACGLFSREVRPRLVQELVETGQVGWRVIPIRLAQFRNSGEAVRAAECAAEQGRFFPLEQTLYDQQKEWQGVRNPNRLLARYAAEAGADRHQWESCFTRRNWRDPVPVNNRAARQLRVNGTPTFFVNNRRVVGALPYASFRAILEEAEAAAYR